MLLIEEQNYIYFPLFVLIGKNIVFLQPLRSLNKPKRGD